ncbi:MAG: hypothetical protein CMN30_09750 [Sandaracinus sp.]|nr:hypothetical protein [Sandaracinus sp.]MAQ15063.1 hypothetical protein [Sandaracinus sp.]|tara:strand:- start:882 stop:1451 length:570 start_codon:yes stop_codon:yes gene_type:complete
MSSQQPIDDDKLQRFYDGDLTEGEAKVVGRDVDASAEEQERVAQMSRLGDILRASAEVESEGIDADALFLRIERGIEKEPVPRLQVIQGQKKKQRTGAVIAAAVAIAAAVTVAFLFRQPVDPNTAQSVHPDEGRLRTAQADIEDPMHVQIHPPGGSSVERVEFGANTGTVFEVQGEQGQPLAVVWIAEE